MAYVTHIYYDETYLGKPISDETEFNRIAKRASEIIDNITNYKIGDIEELGTFIKDQIKKAVSAQIENIVMQGGYDAFVVSGNVNNVSIGSFSYAVGNSNSGGVGGTISINDDVINFLKPTGLLYRGIGVSNGY